MSKSRKCGQTHAWKYLSVMMGAHRNGVDVFEIRECTDCAHREYLVTSKGGPVMPDMEWVESTDSVFCKNKTHTHAWTTMKGLTGADVGGRRVYGVRLCKVEGCNETQFLVITYDPCLGSVHTWVSNDELHSEKPDAGCRCECDHDWKRGAPLYDEDIGRLRHLHINLAESELTVSELTKELATLRGLYKGAVDATIDMRRELTGAQNSLKTSLDWDTARQFQLKELNRDMTNQRTEIKDLSNENAGLRSQLRERKRRWRNS